MIPLFPFAHAMRMAAQGGRVTRLAWGPGQYISRSPQGSIPEYGEVVPLLALGEGVRSGRGCPWTVMTEDVLADDWMVYEDAPTVAAERVSGELLP